MSKLSRDQINELIAKYNSDLAKLKFEMEKTAEIISGLEGQISGATAKPKRRGRPKKAAAKTSTTTKRRGRPKKTATTAAEKPAPKRRGRPKKTATTAAEKPAPKRRGRPKKTATTAAEKPAPKRRGRPKKTATTAAEKPAPKRRGRPKKTATTAAEKPAPKRRGRPKKTATSAAEKPAPKRRGRPKKAASASAAKPTAKKSTGKRGRKAGVKVGGYRLNDYDQFLIDTLKSAGKVQLKSDFVEKGKAKFKSMKEADLVVKLSQSIHKLANKHKVIGKVKADGRGFAYVLPEWMTPSGRVKKDHQA